MAMTLEDVKKLLEKEGLKFFVAPDRPAVMVGFSCVFGHYQFLILLDVEGRFLQFRTTGYASCPPSHRHLTEVLKLLATINYQIRLLKLSWDPSDGEIVGYADDWVMDTKVSQEQFHRMLQNYVSSLDLGFCRIKSVLEEGIDPGAAAVEALAEKIRGGGGPTEV